MIKENHINNRCTKWNIQSNNCCDAYSTQNDDVESSFAYLSPCSDIAILHFVAVRYGWEL